MNVDKLGSRIYLIVLKVIFAIGYRPYWNCSHIGYFFLIWNLYCQRNHKYTSYSYALIFSQNKMNLQSSFKGYFLIAFRDLWSLLNVGSIKARLFTIMAIRVVKFSSGVYKIGKILPKYQHDHRKFLNFDIWVKDEVSKIVR